MLSSRNNPRGVSSAVEHLPYKEGVTGSNPVLRTNRPNVVNLTLLPNRFAVCRLDATAARPPWASSSAFLSITRTPEELSIVCDEAGVPEQVQAVRNWRCLKIEGPIPLEVTGVAASLIVPLGSAGISVFLVATFDTDYLLVQGNTLDAATEALTQAGHFIGGY